MKLRPTDTVVFKRQSLVKGKPRKHKPLIENKLKLVTQKDLFKKV